MTTKVLAEKPEALRRFTAAIIKSSRFFAENKQAWVDGWLRFVRTHGRHPGALRWLLATGFAGRALVWRLAGRRPVASVWWQAARRAISPTRP